MPIIDDFEDGDLSEYSGSHAGISISSAVTYGSSTYSLRMESAANDSYISTTGLASYPSAGDRIRFRSYLEDDVQYAGIYFGQDGTTSSYGFPSSGYGFLWASDSIRLVKPTPSGFTTMSETSFTIPLLEWLETVIDWNIDGSITATVYSEAGAELANVAATGTDYTSGGVGFSKEWNTTIYVDDYTRELINATLPAAPTGLTLTQL